MFFSKTKNVLATVYYVRPDGGYHIGDVIHKNQCNGTQNIAYSENNAPDCAWLHPFEALPPGSTALARISGGDTLVIGKGSYRMGYTPNIYDDSFKNNDNKNPCTQIAPYFCKSTPVPSGPDINHPTRIIGEGWDDGCQDPPELYGVEKSSYIIDLTNSNNIEIECLEITDHDNCGYNYNGHIDGTDLSCKYLGKYPYGDWAVTGLHGEKSENVLIKNMNIHGMGSTGIGAFSIKNWSIQDSKLNFNGYSGWGGGGDKTGSQSNFGYISFNNVQINNNGCIEDYNNEGIIIDRGCYDNYGDGLGTARTSGDWIFDNIEVKNNTSDGLDMLYHESLSGSVLIKNSYFEGNAGNQIKTRGNVVLENNVVIGNCNYFTGRNINGGNIIECRGFGNPISINVPYGSKAYIINNSITRYPSGEAMIELGVQDPWVSIGAGESDDICSEKALVYIIDNLFIGTPTDNKETYAVYWNVNGTCAPDFVGQGYNNFFYNINSWPDNNSVCDYYLHSICDQNPLVEKFNPESELWNLNLTIDSPAINMGLSPGAIIDIDNLFFETVKIPLVDVFDNSRKGFSDIGAYEYINYNLTIIRADVDQNQIVNTIDAVLTLRNSLGLDMSNTNWKISSTTGDANCDDNSNSIDAMLILKKSLGYDMSETGWCDN